MQVDKVKFNIGFKGPFKIRRLKIIFNSKTKIIKFDEKIKIKSITLNRLNEIS